MRHEERKMPKEFDSPIYPRGPDPRKEGKTKEEQEAIDRYDVRVDRECPDYPQMSTAVPEWWAFRQEHHYRQERPGHGYSCPRCFGARIKVDYPAIKCLRCGYQEDLIDFPISNYVRDILSRESVPYNPNIEPWGRRQEIDG